MKPHSRRRRRVVDLTARVLALACVAVALIPLGSILETAAVKGGAVLSVHFLVSAEPPTACSLSSPGCQIGGIGPAILATFALLFYGSLVAMPVGILTGIYLNEFGRHRVGRSMSFLVEVLSGTPSIVVGAFMYSSFVLLDPSLTSSALAGSLALAIIMIPVVARTTEESLRLVPGSVREAAAALGIPQFVATLRVVLPAATSAVVTGAILAVARAGGEAAPLLLTTGDNPRGYVGLFGPTGALPTLIFNWSQQPFENLKADAWGAVLVLILIMLGLSLTARYFLSRRVARASGSA